MSKSKIDVDLSPLIQKWVGNPDLDIPGTHSGGDLQDLRTLLDERFGHDAAGLIARMKLFGKTLIAPPYRHDPQSNVQEFKVLQGDVVKSALASVPFPLYDFEATEAIFVVNPNSCLIQRIDQVVLTRLHPVTKDATGRQRQQLKEALRLKSRRWLYLPALETQPETCVGNIIDFDEVALIRKFDLENATRLASLTQFGWHLFSQFLADFYTKPSADDFKIRRNSGPTRLSIEI